MAFRETVVSESACEKNHIVEGDTPDVCPRADEDFCDGKCSECPYIVEVM